MPEPTPGRTLSPRVPGHGLLHEGRPVLAAGCCGLPSGVNHGHRNHYDRVGHGICSCAAMSPCEDTTAARQRWHRQHKEEAVMGEAEGALYQDQLAKEVA